MDFVLSHEGLMVGTAQACFHAGMSRKSCAAPGCSAFLLERVPTGEPEVKSLGRVVEIQQVCPQESL